MDQSQAHMHIYIVMDVITQKNHANVVIDIADVTLTSPVTCMSHLCYRVREMIWSLMFKLHVQPGIKMLALI